MANKILKTKLQILNKISSGHKIFYAIIAAVFVLSRAIIYFLGVEFNYNKHLYQLLDFELLKDNFFQSLIYLHSQPPLFNFLFGLGEIIFNVFSKYFFNLIYLLIGLLSAFLSFSILIKLNINRIFSLFLILFYVITPAVLLYENWFFYTYIIVFLMIFATYNLLCFLEDEKYKHLNYYFLSLSLIALTSAFFHIIWLLIVISVPIILRWQNRTRIVKHAIIPILIVLSLYLKNLIIFNEFSASSWFGLNFARITVKFIDKDKKNELISRGILTQASKFNGFPKKDDIEKIKEIYPDIKKSGIKVLDQEIKRNGQINFNNKIFIKLSKDALRDVIYIIRNYFTSYLRGISEAIFLYFKSPTDYIFLKNNRENLFYYNKFFDSFLYGSSLFTKTGYVSIVLYPSIIILSFLVFYKEKNLLIRSFIIFSLINILYVFSVSSLLEYGENNRFRFYTEIYFFMLLALVISSIGFKNYSK